MSRLHFPIHAVLPPRAVRSRGQPSMLGTRSRRVISSACFCGGHPCDHRKAPHWRIACLNPDSSEENEPPVTTLPPAGIKHKYVFFYKVCKVLFQKILPGSCDVLLDSQLTFCFSWKMRTLKKTGRFKPQKVPDM